MRTCNNCQVSRTLDRFSLNDFGKFKSLCKDCQSEQSLKRYYAKKEKLNLVKSEDETNCLQSENVDKLVSKCKDFFFYQHG
jgi:hypothetical protein